MDNSLKTNEKPPEEGANAPPAKGKTKTFLIDKKLKTNNLRHTAAERGNCDDNKTHPKTTDSLRQGASQGALTLRYCPAGRLPGPHAGRTVRPSPPPSGRTLRRGELRAESLHSRPTRQVAAEAASLSGAGDREQGGRILPRWHGRIGETGAGGCAVGRALTELW